MRRAADGRRRERAGARARAERGIALALVLAVLVCLLAVAIPFSLSMRHEQGGVAYRTFDDEARRTAASVRDLALARLGDTAPDRDKTPWADGADETAIDVEQAAKSLDLSELGPRGRLISADVEDQSGRIDVNRASLFLTARMLGLSTRLSSKLTADAKEIRLADGDFLQDEGFLWIDGEVTYYKRHEGANVYDFTRPAIVPGIWEPAKLRSPDPREHESGTEVLDFRAWMVAAWLFKGAGAKEARFETLSHPLAIANFGHGALGAEQRARLERFGTIWSSDAGRDRFGDAQRIFSPIVAGETFDLRVEQGHFLGRGTLCRVRTYDGKVEYGFVLRSSPLDNGFKVELEMPLTIAADAYQAVLEVVTPRAVNVNSCSQEVLELLLTGLRFRGMNGPQQEVDERTAKLVAERIVAARPLQGIRDLIALLDLLWDKEKKISELQRLAILTNAEHSGAFVLEAGTAPFCYASDGVFDVRAAASLNYPLNGREKARAFLREIVATSGAGLSPRLFATQRDFEEPWRLTRAARDWTTFPENMNVFLPRSVGSADPQSRLLAMLAPHNRFPSEDPVYVEAGAKLATGRLLTKAMVADRTWHFDGGQNDIDSKDPEGWRIADGVQSFNVEGQGQGVELVQNNAGFTRPRPFGVSLWWNPGRDLMSEQTLFDWQCNARSPNPETNDRVRLRLMNQKLEFDVFDLFLRNTDADRYASTIVYAFDDGLLLEPDTWYHVTVFCRGNRTGQMTLWVDGRPRGRYSEYTRLTSQFDASAANANRVAIDPNRFANGTKNLPTRSAVRVGTEVFEYTSVSGSAFTVMRDDTDHFGGVRPAPNLPPPGSTNNTPPQQPGGNQNNGITHPAGTGVELYGYSARLASDVPAGSTALDANGLGRFGVAMADPAMAKTKITVQGNRGPLDLGMGFESDANEITLRGLDGNKLNDKDKVFQRSGGYALLLSYEFRGLRATDPKFPGGGNDADLDKERTTSNKSIVGGVEVIWYSSYSDSKLSNVHRGQSLTTELGKCDFGEQNKKIIYPYPREPLWLDRHAWVQFVDTGTFPNYKPVIVPVLVIPIGVLASGSRLSDHFLVPEVNSAATDLPELAQIDSNFNANQKDSTEWIRYNALIQDQNGNWNFLRSDPEQIMQARWWIEGKANVSGDSSNFNGTSNGDQIYAIANAQKNGASSWAPGQSDYKTFVAGVNYEDVSNSATNRLAFRGVLETKDSEHSGSAKILPVFRTYLSGGLPGRYDEVTLVGSNGERPERHIVNYAWPKNGCEGWSGVAHVAFLAEELASRFRQTPGLALNPGNPTGYLANVTFNADSRNFARLLKHPSGELPSLWDSSSELVVGGNAARSGKKNASSGAGASPNGGDTGGKVDELRIFAGEDPQPLFAHGLYLLRKDVTVTEENRIEIHPDGLQFPNGGIGGLRGTLLGIHADACVWQIGDDWIVGGERTDGDPMEQKIAPDGRTRLGIVPGFHHAGETAMILPWLAMTRLSSGMSPTDSLISLVDAAHFQRSGYVMIDNEVLGYTDLSPGKSGAQLYVPSYMEKVEGHNSQNRGDAAFRARFGTRAAMHAQDAIVFFWPWRYPDGYVERADIPEQASLELPIAARRALFHSMTWREQNNDPNVSLIASVRVQGRGDFAADPTQDPDFFVFDKPGTPDQPDRIDRQGDLLRLRFGVRYRDGALDAADFLRNSWKRAPLLQLVGVEYLADRVVELHEETR